MCGICGAIGFAATPEVARQASAQMSAAMIHRGPDDHGEFHSSGITLSARRLSIIDVEGGHQPFADDSGSVHAIQNGEIYNHLDLRRDLERKGHRFASRCDTEVIPHMYKRYGLDFAAKLRGMFAIALWDDVEQRAVLVRDRLGIKPLYYAEVPGGLVFASELRCILATGLVPVDFDYEAISAYLELGYFAGPRTPIAGISKLPPGHRLIADQSGLRCEQWWAYPIPDPGPADLGVQHYAEGLLEQLDEAVRLRLMSDVPFGAMLSGGLDSSLIVALMAPKVSGPVQTFSVGFREAAEGNELGFAQRVADEFGCEHHAIELSMKAESSALPDLAWQLDEPAADLSIVGFSALSRVAASTVTMSLSGQGADELLGGYTKHKAAAVIDRVPSFIAAGRLGKALATVAPSGIRRAMRALAAPSPATRLLEMSSLPAWAADKPSGGAGVLPAGAALRAVQAHARCLPTSAGALASTLYLDAKLALVDIMLHYFDRMSMAHSLEVRVPFLDHHLVEFCATIPLEYKVHGLVTKYALKQAAKGLVPDEIINRKKVGFFRQSTARWLGDPDVSLMMKSVLLDDSARYREFLDPRLVELRLGRMAGNDEPAAGRSVLALLMLELWLKRATGI